MAMNFLTDAGRYGDPRRAAAALPGARPAAGHRQCSASGPPTSRPGPPVARAAAGRAAEAQLAAGFTRHGIELAELARQPTDARGRYERAAAALLRQARERLGSTQTSAAALAPAR